MSNVVDEAIDALREAIVAQEKINQSLRGVIARLGPRQSPPVCPYCWGDRQDGLTDAEWGDQVARCSVYKPSYDVIRRTLWAYGKPFTGRLSGAHLRVDLARGSDRTERIEVCPRCGQSRASNLSQPEWDEQIESCRRGRASVPKVPDCPKCGLSRWSGATDAAWLAEVAECQANKEKG